MQRARKATVCEEAGTEEAVNSGPQISQTDADLCSSSARGRTGVAYGSAGTFGVIALD